MKKKRLIFIGPPGVGKGTYSKIISKEYNIPHLAMGDLIREEISKKTKIGKEMDKIISKGHLLDDITTFKLLKKRIEKKDCKSGGFILDGFPRRLTQAVLLDKFLINQKYQVIFIDGGRQILEKRMLNRWICPKCGKVYNPLTNPPNKKGYCDDDKTKLIKRKDDNKKVISERFKIYHETIDPIIKYYKGKNVLRKINGERKIPQVIKSIEKILNN